MKKISKKLQKALDNLPDNDYIVCMRRSSQPRVSIMVCKAKCKKIAICKSIKKKIEELDD